MITTSEDMVRFAEAQNHQRGLVGETAVKFDQIVDPVLGTLILKRKN